MSTPVLRDEFETVKQLLASAAAYAESANRRGDQNAEAIAALRETQKQNAEAIARLEASQNRTEELLQELIIETRERQLQTDEQLQQLTGRVDTLTERVDTLTQRVDSTSEQLDRLAQRVDSFVFESQRLFSQHGQTITRLEAMISRYDGVLAYLMRTDHPEME